MFIKTYFHLLGLIAVLGVFSCKSQDTILKNSDELNKTFSMCPDDGKCSYNSFPNTAVKFHIDEFGMGYIEYLKKKSTLLKFEYQRDTLPNTADGHYIERVYIELPPAPKSFILKDNALQQVNLLFERLCYCKGETGIYQINTGTLSLTPLDDGRFHLKLHFKTSEVPQILTEIDEIITLDQSNNAASDG
ncbi:hypothetical protein [uncultured Gelidibacter sp.]|uniref:hypothetical protein n=1 Tax=uncultured Gelidibacter sp. TaxID=259318 RepID=UPI00261326D1|nr:hypothetical protein [uncultured Gelidibacter sp.]